jgi:GT2 family glycosyltransferase
MQKRIRLGGRRRASGADVSFRAVPTLTAIVPATDAPATLQKCREAIEAADEPPEQLVVVTEADAPGPAAARNTGALEADGDVLVFVDSDVLVHADAFGRVREAFRSDPGLTAVFGSYDDDPRAPGVVSGFRNLLHHHVHQKSPGPVKTFWAGLGAIRRDAFEAAGGFDGGRFERASVEDIDLGLRLTRTGSRIELDPELQGTHLRRWTLGGMLWTDLVRRGMPWVAVLLRNRGSRPWRLNLAWRNRVSMLLLFAAVVAAVAVQPWAAVGAAAALLGLNHSLYLLVWRRRGPLQGIAAVGLHLLHLVAAALSIPLGIVSFLRDRDRAPLPALDRRGAREQADRQLGAAAPEGAASAR